MARRFDRLGWAMDQTDLEPPERFVLLILADMANEQGECWPSHNTVAERTGYSRRGVQNFIASLTAKSKIAVTPRWGENGRLTSNLYTLQAGQLVDAEGGTTFHREGAPGAIAPSTGFHSVEPPNRTSRKNNSTATQQSGSSRHASRARDDSAWDDPAARVFAKEQEPDDSEPGERPRTARSHGPDSAWALNGYYRQAVFVAGTGRVGNTNDGAMRKFFAEARRCGVRPATLRAMVDCFVEDPQLFNRTRTHRWKVFIANAPMLQERASNIIGVEPMEAGKEQFGGAIPKKVLDEILAEVG